MEHEELELTPEEAAEQEPKKGYIPRPAWQVWGARIGLVIVIIAIILYYWNMVNGGLS